MIRDKLKQRIKFSIIMLIIAIAISAATFSIMIYQVEGEKEVPFELKKIIVISSASVSDVNNDGMVNSETVGNQEVPTEQQQNAEQQQKYLWEKNVIQTNDICILLNKNEQFKEDQIIKSVKIENILEFFLI